MSFRPVYSRNMSLNLVGRRPKNRTVGGIGTGSVHSTRVHGPCSGRHSYTNRVREAKGAIG